MRIDKLYDDRLANAPDILDPLSYFKSDIVCVILESVYFGAKIEHALQIAGVPYRVYLHWRAQAADHNGLARQFMFTLEKYIAQFEMNHLKNLQLISSIDAKASIFLLERTRDGYEPRSFITTTALTGGYMDDLVGLVSSGAMTVKELVSELGELDPQQKTLLYGVEAERLEQIAIAKEKTDGLMTVRR